MHLSLSHALHSLRNPHHFGRSTAAAAARKTQENADAEQTAFDGEIRILLSGLQLPADQDFLTLPWLQDSVNCVLFTCSHVSDLLPRITCSEKEKVLLEANLEDTLSLLDVCNCLKEALCDVQHYVMLIRYAARASLDVKDMNDEELMSKLSRLRCALDKSAEFMHARVEENSRHREGRSKLETCSSMLRRIGEPLSDASPGSKRAASHALFNDMYAAKVLTIFVCSILALSLSVKPKRPLSCVFLGKEPTWLDSLQELQENMKKLTDKTIQQSKIALLKELDDLRSHAHKLSEFLQSIFKQETPAADIDKISLNEQCERLTLESENLQQGLTGLQQDMDSLFRKLVGIRVDFLNTLCHV